ncbi:MAG: hypothetical protein MUC50_18620 [Myxococcota bacterium]|jgi:lipopolysaccharide biosynthesis regulator YciM|nr:hypothetical protein [Myxococcota bacterium]
MTETSTASTPFAAILQSLLPSAVQAEFNAIGPPPQRLSDLEAAAPPVSREFLERIRALAKGANAAFPGNPLRAAACWHEAGRLLWRRAGHPAEAWNCHSRALAIHPDYKPARDAMRRLARIAGDRETLSLIIDSQIGRLSNPCETACLLSEQAALEIEAGHFAEAMDSLRAAASSYPGALVPPLLKLGVAVNQSDDGELAQSLEVMIEKWPDSAGAVGLKLILALFEERLNLLDAAVSRLDSESGESLSLSGLWARVRLRLRHQRYRDAFDDLRVLARSVEDPSMRAALNRFAKVLCVFSLDCEPGENQATEEDNSGNLADLELLAAIRTQSQEGRTRALGRLSPRANSPRLQAAIAISRDVAAWADGQSMGALAKDTGPVSPGAGALAALLCADFPWEPGATVLSAEVDPSVLLYGSLASRDLGQAAGDFAELRDRVADREDRWALAVAEAYIRLHCLDQPELALAALRGEDLASAREPLPSLLRMVDRTSAALAKLSESQAEIADTPALQATYIAWAARHQETSQRDRARELFDRALGLDPSCLLALCGLERVGASTEELAKAWTRASEAAPLSLATFYFVRAYFWHRLGGAHAKGAALLLKAQKNDPSDLGLWELAFKAASAHMRSALSAHVLLPPAEELSAHERTIIGSLALEIAPEHAAPWFLSAVEQEKDAIYLLGCEEALFVAGKGEQVMSSLAAELVGKEGAAAARLAVRLALSCQRQGEGNRALLRHVREIARRVPGHRPTAIKRMILAGLEREKGEMALALRDLAATTTDKNMVSASAVAAWQLTKGELAASDLASRLDERCALAHVELEGKLEDHLADARRVALGRVLALLPKSVSHWMRRAELDRDSGAKTAAAQAYRQASEVSPEDPLPLARLASLEWDEELCLEALVELARRCEVSVHKRECLRAAALVASQQPLDRARAGKLWAELLAASPQDDEAFEQALRFADELADRHLRCEVLSLRLTAELEPETKRKLHMQLVEPYLELGQRDRAKEHLLQAAELMDTDTAAHLRLAELHRQDGEWHAAIERLTTAARIARDPEQGIPIFFALGQLYMDHSPRADLAEKSFLKVLGWDVEHVPSLERLADLYHRDGNFVRAVQALEHLVRLGATPRERTEKSLVLAELLNKECDRPADAERVLLDAWEADFTDLRPIDELSRLLERRADSLSLNVFVDRAVASYLAVASKTCEDAAALGRVARLYELRRHTPMAILATEARDIALGGGGRSESARWNLGARLADPTYEEMICPKELTAALRAVLQAVEEPLARALGVWAKQIDFAGETKLGRKSPLNVSVVKLAQVFGLEPPVVYASDGPSLRLYPGSPGALVVPQEVVESESQPQLSFVAASAAQGLRHGLGLSTVVEDDALIEAIFTVIGLVAPGAAPPVPSSSLSAGITEFMTGKVALQVQPFVLDVIDAFTNLDVPALMRQSMDRAGLLGCGSLWDAMSALRLIHAQSSATLGELEGYSAIVAFCLGKVHLDLREVMGI